MELYEHQKNVLELTKDKNRCAYYLDMGLGKTFVGSEKMMKLGEKVNLIICQKSKIQDWVEHLKDNYSLDTDVVDLTNKKDFESFINCTVEDDLIDWNTKSISGVINYELAWRRKDLLKLSNFTLMLDESSLISNEKTERCKFILKLKPKNVILLSGTPTAGKYERLWSQCKLLGWNINKTTFWNSYIVTKLVNFGGFVQKQVVGYQHIEHLKRKLSQYGAVFMKTDEVITLPSQTHQNIYVNTSSDYKKFVKNKIVTLDNGDELVGDNVLTNMLYRRQLCGHHNKDKLNAFKDLLESTEDRLVVFYNFNAELDSLMDICESLGRPTSEVNGHCRNLDNFEKYDDSILFVQYQAGAMGGNYQKANKIVYFSLPLGKGSCDLWEQSKKRIHRIGQDRPCFYYYMLCRNSIETWNLSLLKEGKELTDDLFRKEEKTCLF